MRRALATGYDRHALGADILAGVVVGIVALPLSMALAVAVGVAPQHGLYTAVVAGFLVAVLGGSKFQVTGPTAAFIVVLAPVVTAHGLAGLLTATAMAGILLLLMGLFGMGRLIQFIPYPVTTGFTAGIATVIAILQIKDVFGLKPLAVPDGTFRKLVVFWEYRHTAALSELGLSLLALGLLIALPRVFPRLTRSVPTPLLALVGSALAAGAVQAIEPSLHVATIGSRFETMVGDVLVPGIPRTLPSFGVPWGTEGLEWQSVRDLAAPAFAIAVLGAIESLLSAVVADGLTGTRHNPDAELVALGVGNIVAPFFGGIAATGALARTATNIRAGARSPISAVVHALVVLLAILLFAPLVAYIPMSGLAALLLLVAWNMSEVRHFKAIVATAPRSDVFVLLTCYALTVAFDMVIAVSVGVVLAALLFMRRMAELTSSRLLDSDSTESDTWIPDGMVLYEIAGPLFFGAAQQAMRALDTVGSRTKLVVISLAKVSVIDASGLVALESAVSRFARGSTRVVLSGPFPGPHNALENADLPGRFSNVVLVDTLEDAINLANRHLQSLSVKTTVPRG